MNKDTAKIIIALYFIGIALLIAYYMSSNS